MYTNEQLTSFGNNLFSEFKKELKQHSFANHCLDNYYMVARDVNHTPFIEDSKILLNKIYYEVLCFSTYCLVINAVDFFKIKKFLRSQFDQQSWHLVYDAIKSSFVSEFNDYNDERSNKTGYSKYMFYQCTEMDMGRYMHNLVGRGRYSDLLVKIEEAKRSYEKMGCTLFSEKLSISIDPTLAQKYFEFKRQWEPVGMQLFELTKITFNEVRIKFQK